MHYQKIATKWPPIVLICLRPWIRNGLSFQALLDFSAGFERRLAKQSRVYIVIVIIGLKDQILKT